MIGPGSKLPEFKTVRLRRIEKAKEFAGCVLVELPGKWLILYRIPRTSPSSARPRSSSSTRSSRR